MHRGTLYFHAKKYAKGDTITVTDLVYTVPRNNMKLKEVAKEMREAFNKPGLDVQITGTPAGLKVVFEVL
jgi:hypothetical protein